MNIKAWLQRGLAVVRWLSMKVATVIRWVSVVAIAVGLGIAVAHSVDEGAMQSIFLYCLLPGGVGFFVAHVLHQFGNRRDET